VGRAALTTVATTVCRSTSDDADGYRRVADALDGCCAACGGGPAAATWGTEPAAAVLVVCGAVLVGAVLAAQESGVHLALFGSFLFLAINP